MEIILGGAGAVDALGLIISHELGFAVLTRSAMSDSLQPRGLRPARLLCPWGSPGENAGVACRALLRGSSQPQGPSQVSGIAGGFFTS